MSSRTRKKAKVSEQHKSRPWSRGASTASESERGAEQSTLYDAVAGRVGYEGFISSHQDYKRQPSKPEEVLFRRKNAPERTEEDDPYFANRHLPPGERLPDSDLLKAIHAYASDFYGAMDTDGKSMDFKSLDETALLAIGILLEEAAGQTLGATGDFAFVEGPDAKT